MQSTWFQKRWRDVNPTVMFNRQGIMQIIRSRSCAWNRTFQRRTRRLWISLICSICNMSSFGRALRHMDMATCHSTVKEEYWTIPVHVMEPKCVMMCSLEQMLWKMILQNGTKRNFSQKYKIQTCNCKDYGVLQMIPRYPLHITCCSILLWQQWLCGLERQLFQLMWLCLYMFKIEVSCFK